MEKDILSFAVEKTHELIGAPTCSSETKAAAEAWLNAVGTEQEAEETKKYIDELEADIMPIDNLISFAGSEADVYKRQVTDGEMEEALKFILIQEEINE